MKKPMKKRALLAAACALGLVCCGLGFAVAAPLGAGKTAQAEESFGGDWTAHEKSAIEISGVEEGGVGTISYRTVPKEDGSKEFPYGNPDGPVYNSVRIPCKGYDIADDRVSIKYAADFPVGGKNITVYAALTADVGSDGGDLAAEDELIGWFENWNVSSGQTQDGYKYVTIDHANYTDFRTVSGIVLQFNYEGDVTRDKTMRVLGMDFHAAGEKPVFATDPKPFSLSEPAAQGCTAVKEGGAWKVSVAGTGSIVYAAQNWNGALADRLVVDCEAFEGARLTPVLDGNELEPVLLSSERLRAEIPAAVDSLSRLVFSFSGTGTIRIYSVAATTAPKVTNWSTSNASYFDEMEELSDSVYQMHYKRNATAGYPKVIVSVENWRENYDIVCVDLRVMSGKVLAGILLSDQKYLMTHWNADNVVGEGTHEFTFYYPLEIDPAWDGSRFIIYVNPSSVSVDGYTYDAEFDIGIHFMKSESLPGAEITVSKEVYEYEYDGTAKSVTAAVSPENTPYKTFYIKDGHASENPPTEVGEYTVRFEVEGTRERKRTVKEVRLVISAVEQLPPTAEEWSFDYDNGTIVLAAGLEASYLESFDSLLPEDGTVLPSSVLYIRRAAENGRLPSKAARVNVPSKPDRTPTIELIKCTRTSISVNGGEGVEYRLITGSKAGEWKDEGNFVGLKADTLYRVEARVKAGEASFAGDIAELAVRTKLTNDSAESSSSEEESSAGKKGCRSAAAPGALVLLALAAAVGIAVKRREK